MLTASLPQLVYVVRLWQSDATDEKTWRASVQNPGSGERHIFADLEEFFAFVEEQTRAARTNASPTELNSAQS